MLLGEKSPDILAASHVAIFGIGGVGSFAAEALARCGIGRITLVDHDRVSPTNLNRQLIALNSTIGQPKVQVMRERILDINPHAMVNARECFFTAENADAFDFSDFSYIADAIDTVSSKLILIGRAKSAGVPVISCMGAGNKLDPTRLEVSDIYATSICPLARVMRRELKARGIDSLKVVYSKEPPLSPVVLDEPAENPDSPRRQTPGSVAFVPSVAGLIMAGEIVKELVGYNYF